VLNWFEELKVKVPGGQRSWRTVGVLVPAASARSPSDLADVFEDSQNRRVFEAAGAKTIKTPS